VRHILVQRLERYGYFLVIASSVAEGIASISWRNHARYRGGIWSARQAVVGPVYSLPDRSTESPEARPGYWIGRGGLSLIKRLGHFTRLDPKKLACAEEFFS
jgi:hypothetical protein